MRRRHGMAALLCAASAALVSCSGNGVYGVDLPGGPDLGSHPYTVTAQFTDALDLVRQAAVKVGDVPVGQVGNISLGAGGRLALVQLQINGDVRLPANATASIQQTSLLGEKYVELTRPAAPTGTLRNGATIPVSSTSQGIEFEQVFGALSLLLNGGGVAQLHDIVLELDKAVGGRGADLRELLHNADVVISQIDAHRSDVITALDRLDRLSQTLSANRSDINVALRDLPAGLKILARQRTQLVGMLDSLGRLSRVTVRTVRASRNSFVGDLRSLSPILRRLAAAGDALPRSLQILLTYPFPDSVLRAIPGDYLNAFITQNLNTPGGEVVRIQHRSPAGPPALLPPTSSAATGLPSSTVVTTPNAKGGR
ncbi:MAG TPA: MCE family protein [Jatrophihabitans sp.]|nr:MCE family protein [Jatrophihabitans sp.]